MIYHLFRASTRPEKRNIVANYTARFIKKIQNSDYQSGRQTSSPNLSHKVHFEQIQIT